MIKRSTPKKKFTQEKEVAVDGPSSHTINFLKFYARTFYVDKKVPEELSNVCVN